MSPFVALTILIIYFAVLIAVSFYTSKGADTNTFFTANKQSPWFLVAFAMIGTSVRRYIYFCSRCCRQNSIFLFSGGFGLYLGLYFHRNGVDAFVLSAQFSLDLYLSGTTFWVLGI